MENKFKVGDLVYCESNDTKNLSVEIGKVYKVVGVRRNLLIIENKDRPDNSHFKHKFKKAVPKNVLSDLLYPKNKTTECGKYLII